MCSPNDLFGALCIDVQKKRSRFYDVCELRSSFSPRDFGQWRLTKTLPWLIDSVQKNILYYHASLVLYPPFAYATIKKPVLGLTCCECERPFSYLGTKTANSRIHVLCSSLAPFPKDYLRLQCPASSSASSVFTTRHTSSLNKRAIC